MSNTALIDTVRLNTAPLKIIFAGTPDFSATVLDAILSQGHAVSAVYCQPDRRVGRGKKLAFGPVKSLAVDRDIPVEQPVKFNQETDENGLTAIDRLTAYKPDLMIVVAYGLILPEDVLAVPKFGCVNIHASILPRWRGAAPIQRVIESGDEQTGVTIMQMDKGLDTGNMLAVARCNIDPQDTGSTLHDRLAEVGVAEIIKFLVNFSAIDGSPLSPGEIQDDQYATYAHKLSKKEAEIDWSETAVNIERQIRAFNSWPVCFTYAGRNRLRVWQAKIQESPDNPNVTSISNKSFAETQPGEIIKFDKSGILVACGDQNAILLQQLQADGSRSMSAAELLNSKSQWFVDHPLLGQSL